MNRETLGNRWMPARIALTWIAVLAAGFPAASVDLGDLNVPASRIPTWQAGVTGGMPDTSDVSKWPVCIGSIHPACALSPNPSRQALQDALNAAGNLPLSGSQQGWVVSVPAGTTVFPTESDSISIPSNVVLRGAGKDKTIISGARLSGQPRGHIVMDGSVGPERTVAGSGAIPIGTTRFTLSDTSGFRIGEWATLEAKNLDGYSYELNQGICGNPGCDYIFHHMGEVRCVGPGAGICSGLGANDILLDRGLPIRFERPVVAQAVTPVRNAGIENLYSKGKTPVSSKGSGNVVIQYAVDVWIDGVKLTHGSGSNLQTFYASNWTYTNSEMEYVLRGHCEALAQNFLNPPDGCNYISNNYGIELGRGTQQFLIINSEFYNMANDIRPKDGVYGGVIANNYQHDGFHEFGGIMFHGLWPFDNLVEGNDLETTRIRLSDFFWGRNGPQVVYRNRMQAASGTGFMLGSTGDTNDLLITESVIVGNVAYSYGRMCSNYFTQGCVNHDIDMGGVDLWMERNIAFDQTVADGRGFLLATPEPTTSCGTGAGDCPSGQAGSGPNAGNAIYGSNIEAQRAPNAGSGHPTGNWAAMNVPFSLYFSSRQDWESQSGATWCAEACAFEDAHAGIGAWGDDMSSGSLCKLPAQIRIEGGSCTPLGGSAPPARLGAPTLLTN